MAEEPVHSKQITEGIEVDQTTDYDWSFSIASSQNMISC